MSVMVRDEEGRCFVYTKGAEVAMLDPRVSSRSDIPAPERDSALSQLCYPTAMR